MINNNLVITLFNVNCFGQIKQKEIKKGTPSFIH